MTASHRPSGIRPVLWMAPAAGTNGYVSSWGSLQSGVVPTFDV